MGHGNKELAILGLMYMLGKCFSECQNGFESRGRHCFDVDECKEHLEQCGENTKCFNTNGSFYCQCEPGYSNKRNVNFTSLTGQCQDINECIEDAKICGHGAYCTNLIGSYKCNCHLGYTNATSSHRGCIDIDECNETENPQEDICGMGGSCKNINGSYWCQCLEGFTNYGNKRTPCSELTCDNFNMDSRPEQSLRGLENILKMMRNSCLTLYNPSPTGEESADGIGLLEILLTETDTFLSPGSLDSSEHVTLLLNTVENSIKLIGPQLKENHTKRETNEIEAEIAVERGKTRPIGLIHLANQNASLVTDWETATGLGTYPGFALAALLSYKSLVISADKSFEELKGHARDGVDPFFKIGSRVVSVVVSNPSTQNLSHSVNITLRHVQDTEESPEYICAYWKETGVWSEDGCYKQWSNASHTVCICSHLSSFAVLMALYDMEHPFALTVLTKIGLSISLLCLILSILTFKFCRSIQGTRTAIHLHLCVCLFMADLIFLAGISQTKNVGGCRAVAALLHYFFLGVFTWMLLEGVQLYRMVVLVFNATIRPLYLYVTGYGMPLVIIIISAIIRPDGYGTKKHCWLSLENGFIWSFFGPVCLIIVINVFFFIITVWKLAQKFTSLNPDLSKLHKIKAFTVTAIAQMCILGLMWAFGAFLFHEGTTVVAYIFTILNSLQGALVFIMHCLLSKQVREEYAYFLSCICKLQTYSDLSSTNPSSSQSQGSQTGPHTRESQT